MTLVLCLDDRGGRMFNHRRQSRDRLLIADLVSSFGADNVFVTAYSLPLFDGYPVKQIGGALPETAVVFCEDADPLPYLSACDTVVLYHWNRSYPSDVRFDRALLAPFTLAGSTDFVGSSHDTITKEIYRK